MNLQSGFYAFRVSVLAPKSHEARNGDVRRIALTKRHKAITNDDIKSPIVSIATTLFPPPEDRNPFMNARFGMKR